MLQSVLCITTNKYLVHVLVVLLHARFSVVGPLLAAIFFPGHPYIGSTTVLPDYAGSLNAVFNEKCKLDEIIKTSVVKLNLFS